MASRWPLLRFASLALLGACARAERPPVVALITIDTWRADHLDAALTPNLWRHALAGERYTHAWSPIGLTTAAHVSMMTGLLPWEHGVEANNHHGYALDPGVSVLAGQERWAGFARGAFVSAWPAGPAGGLDRGWERFDGPEAGERPGGVAVEHALAWLPDDRPALLWVHLYEPHGPYEGVGEGERARYAEEVHRADALLAPLLVVLDERKALVVVAGDHGEILDEERCSWQHERSSAEAVLHVPLLRWGPGIAPAVREEWVGITAIPALLAGEAAPVQPRWLGESGICEPGCNGCAPAGLEGRDRVGLDVGGRWLLRPGIGLRVEGTPTEETRSALLAIPPVAPPGQAPDLQQLRALGYTEP